MRRSNTLLLALALVSCTLASPASASQILVSFTPDGFDCVETIPQFQPFTFYIMAYLVGDAAVDGITGAEFQVRNFPAGWFGTPTPNPFSNVSIGNPLAGGCNIAFPVCQPGTNGLVLLYTVTGFSTTAVSNLLLQVDRREVPTNPNRLCAAVVLCDAPVFGVTCVSGGTAMINGPCPCCPATEPTNWSAMKSLYGRN